MEPNSPKYIEKNSLEEPSEDFDFLVSKGINLLQKLTGNTWTDFNYHDPGVTILEQLCFAFTDLSYRTGFDIKDILSDEFGKISKAENSFLDKKKILTTNAVTTDDFRKVIIDEIEEVDNVDVIPILSIYSASHIKGFYEMRVKLKDYLATELKSDPNFISKIEKKIRKTFVSKRNLCEDLNSKIVILKPQTVTIQAEIIIKEFIRMIFNKRP
jgi:nucleoside-triphosphatase THEP1